MKLSYKIRVEMRLVTQSTKREAMRSKETVREKSIGDETKGIMD